MLRSQQRFRGEAHDIFTEKVNKIVLGSNDDKRLQTLDGITLYPYDPSARRVYKTELIKNKE